MGLGEDSLRTQKAKLEAYGRIRPVLERWRHDPVALQTVANIVWELLSEDDCFTEIATAIQDGLNYVGLGLQKLEQRVIMESGAQERLRVVIGWSSEAGRSDCGICGKPGIDIAEGPVLTLEGEGAVVCERCAERDHPELVGLIHLLTRNPAFVTALKEMRADSGAGSAPPLESPSPPPPKKKNDFNPFG